MGQESFGSSLSAQAPDQLTISGLARNGQPDLENHKRLRAPLSCRDVQKPSAVIAADGRWCSDMMKVSGFRKLDTPTKGLLGQ